MKMASVLSDSAMIMRSKQAALTMRRLRVLTFLSLALTHATNASEPASHCTRGERTYFTCEVDQAKVLSLCGVPTKEGSISGRRYVFGRRGLPELVYPQKGKGLFLYNDYAAT